MGGEGFLVSPQVMHETVDGETIIIDLSSGTYYSLRGSAPAIWAALAQGAGSAAIVTALEGAYDAEPGSIEASVADLVRQLESERLIAPGTAPAAPVPTFEPAADGTFDEPQLEKYEDLQDIILLDPVHRVDDAGWPHAAPAAADGA
jgi:hypothetical protein